MIRFSKKGEMDASMEERCDNKAVHHINGGLGLQFYTIEAEGKTIYVIDDSGTPYKDRLEVIKLLYLKSIK